MTIGRVPILEADPIDGFFQMFNRAKDFKQLLKKLNPDTKFIIELDEDQYPTVAAPESGNVLVPERWNDNTN